MKSVPEQPAGAHCGSTRSGLSSLIRTKRTPSPLDPAGVRELSSPMLASVKPAAPVPLTASWKFVPLAEVSIVNSRVVAEAPSPHPADGSIRNSVTSIARGSSTTRVGVPAFGLPGSTDDGLKADQVVPCDWSSACAAPQPADAPVLSLTASIVAPPFSAAQSRTRPGHGSWTGRR